MTDTVIAYIFIQGIYLSTTFHKTYSTSDCYGHNLGKYFSCKKDCTHEKCNIVEKIEEELLFSVLYFNECFEDTYYNALYLEFGDGRTKQDRINIWNFL